VGVFDSAGDADYHSINVIKGDDDSDDDPNKSSITIGYLPKPAYASQVITLFASGGVSPYRFSVVSGSGTLDGNKYISETAEDAIIQAIDVLGKSSTIVVSISKITVTGCSRVIPVYRFYRADPKIGGGHFFTEIFSEGTEDSRYVFEGDEKNLYVCGKSMGAFTKMVHKCYNDDSERNFLSIEADCEGQSFKGTLGYIANSDAADRQAISRYFYPPNGHVISVNEEEADTLIDGWVLDGLQGYFPLP
jgi:hypothetical protein